MQTSEKDSVTVQATGSLANGSFERDRVGKLVFFFYYQLMLVMNFCLFVVSALHFATYLTGLSSMMLI